MIKKVSIMLGIIILVVIIVYILEGKGANTARIFLRELFRAIF